jgi:lipopolysaccharide transport system ATP-binding protein
MSTITDNSPADGRPRGGPQTQLPTIFHVTHWKAGSTWLARILAKCTGERFIRPRKSPTHLVPHFLEDPIKPGGVYPRVYVTREEFESVDLPRHWRRFIVIRDLRDTLVSGYFSVKLSHRENPMLAEDRARLQELSQEAGLASMLDHFMITKSAEIQDSWVRAEVPLIRYEDLLRRDVPTLQWLLLERCELPLERGQVRRIVQQCRFVRLSGGRARGEEDVSSHFRKGVQGDWRNYFSPELKQAFKERWGKLLIATGYETDQNW